jgi:hypothetical protein
MRAASTTRFMQIIIAIGFGVGMGIGMLLFYEKEV